MNSLNINNIFRKLKDNKTIVQNTGYLSIIEIVRLAMPFIALPYIIRTVGAENYGLAVFAQTIISYFTIFINFGLDISAVKNISINRNDIAELNKIVSSVLLIKLVLFTISFLLLLIGLWIIPFLKIHRLLFLFAFLTCFSELLFPTWFYQGIEKMKYLTLIKTTSILFYTISVFLFIHKPEHYTRIVLLQSLGNLFAGVMSFYLLLRIEKVQLIKSSYKYIKQTFTDSIPFFFSRLSAVLNSAMAKTISGIFFSMQAVAAFDLAQKIATVALVPMQMLNQAIYPHIAKTLNKEFVAKFLKINIFISLLTAIIVYLSAPLAIKFFANGQMPEAITLTRILALWVFVGGITTYIGAPVLVSFGFSKPFNRSVLLSTIILFINYVILYIGNIFTIYNFAFALILSEIAILKYRCYFCWHYKIFIYNGRL
ncbi:MAG TPA: oligosaccharide flippase family protein [Petrimonas sp.]|uniref:oligosaccharide flippase family protein n=1 Tax=Petrimonas sp. TaxID=2023866 RepID=UPI001765A177|nr:oligosaccharide flippase family protein [Petrimonas sp.]